MLEKNKTKKEIITDFQRKPKDSGSSEVQIAILTNRINLLTEHGPFIGRRSGLIYQ